MLHRLRGLAAVSELFVQGRYTRKVKVVSRGERLQRNRAFLVASSIFVASSFGLKFKSIKRITNDKLDYRESKRKEIEKNTKTKRKTLGSRLTSGSYLGSERSAIRVDDHALHRPEYWLLGDGASRDERVDTTSPQHR